MTTQIKAGVIAANAVNSSELASGALSGQNFTGDIIFSGTTQGTRLGLGVAPHTTAGLNITTTNQHMRLNNGSELGIIHVLSTGELELWGHGDGESINFRTGSGSGTVAMNIVGNNVGIGTSSPTRTFEVNSGTTNVVARFESTDSRAVVELKDPSGTAELGNIGNDIYFAPAGVEKVRIDSSGNLIMTAGGTIRAGGVNDLILDAGESGTPDIYLQSGGATKVKIEGSNGNVGIGTTSPSADLTLISRAYNSSEAGNSSGIRFTDEGSGSADAILQSIRVGDDGAHLLMGSNCYTATNGGIVQFDSTENSTYVDCNTYNGAIIFGTSTAGSNPDERMRIDSSGNVGINNTECSHKLHVEENGTGAITSIRVANENTSVGDGSQILFTSGTSTVGAAIASYGTALNQASLLFKAGGDTERMRINSSGQVLIGTSTNPTYNHRCVISGNANIDGVLRVEDIDGSVALSNVVLGLAFPNDVDATTGYFVYMTDGNGAIGSISVASGTSVSFNTTSDERLKKNIVDASSQLDTIKNIKVREFDWNKNDYHEVGVIAQEIINVVPNAVQEGGDDVTKHPFGVDYGKIVPYLIKAIQEQQTIIDDLKSRLDEAGL